VGRSRGVGVTLGVEVSVGVAVGVGGGVVVGVEVGVNVADGVGEGVIDGSDGVALAVGVGNIVALAVLRNEAINAPGRLPAPFV